MTSDSTARTGSLLVIFLTVFIDLLGFGMVLPLLPIYAKQLNVDETGTVLALLMSSFSLMQFLFAPVWGRVSDRVGRRPIILLGLTGSVVFYTIFGLASASGSLTWMFVSRIGAGIAGATIPTAQAYIADTTEAAGRTRGMALIGMAFGLGFTFGPLIAAASLIGGSEESLSPWPGYVAALLSAVALLLATFKLPESLRAGSTPKRRVLFDFASFRDAFKVPTLGPLLLTSFTAVLSFANFEAILALVLKVNPEEGGFGHGFQNVLLLFAVLGFTHAMAQGYVRQLAKRKSEKWLATTGAATSIVGYVLLTFATQQQSLSMFIPAMLIEAVGFAFIPAALSSLISRRSDPARQGGILGVAQSLSALARILGHGMCFPLFFVTATLPFIAGAALMGLALVLIVANAGRGEDSAGDRQQPETDQ